MKKRVIISIVLLILSFCTCAVTFAIMANQIGKLRGSLYDAVYTAEEYGISDNATQAVLTGWDDVKKSLDVFLDEKDVREIEKIIPSIGDSLRRNDIKRYCELCSECINYLGVLLDNITLSIESIL
jgi:hypothetical protein